MVIGRVTGYGVEAVLGRFREGIECHSNWKSKDQKEVPGSGSGQ